jgi:hypothetical protein
MNNQFLIPWQQKLLKRWELKFDILPFIERDFEYVELGLHV